jgi:hypothetical protein
MILCEYLDQVKRRLFFCFPINQENNRKVDLQHIAELIAKHLRLDISDCERRELEAWLDASPGNREFLEKEVTEERILASLRASYCIDKEAIWERFLQLKDEYIRNGGH